MNIRKVRKIAKEKGVIAGSMNMPELIRSIQKAEGNYDCFGSSRSKDCPEMNCLWREDCMKGT